MSRQNSFEGFGLQVSPDGQFINWTIIKLQNGQWVLKQPGDKVPEDVDVEEPPRYFWKKEEAEKNMEILQGTQESIVVPEVDARKFIGRVRGIRRYEVFESDWDAVLSFVGLLPWMRMVLKLFRERGNQPTSFAEIETLLPPAIAAAAVHQFASNINLILAPHGFRVLKTDKPEAGSSWDVNSTFQLFFAPAEDRRKATSSILRE